MVPDGWKKDILGNLFEFKNGLNAEKEQYGSGYKFVNVMDIFGNDILVESKIIGRVQVKDKQLDDYQLKYGDVLFNRTSETFEEIAMAAVYLDKAVAIFGGFVIRGRPKTNDISPDFSAFMFQGLSFRKQVIKLGQGAVRANIGQKDLAKVDILVPSIEEQSKIANILSTWDKAISTTKKLLANSQKQKKAVMQQLLTGKKRFSEFKEDWKHVELGSLLEYKQPTPYLVKSTDYNDDYETPVLTAGKTFVLGYTNESEGIYKDKLPVIIFDDFTTDSKFVDFPFKAKSSAMKILTARDGVSIKYVFEAMQMLDFTIGGHQRHWISIFSNLKIAIPEIAEQQKIASVLSTADSEIKTLKQQLNRLEQEKKALMQQLLTGKRRVRMEAE
ncbi:TPA: restriction endonuclease subunit S [Salmonella enterica]|uniref:Restriction endonuclease subunit S n=1 Tax=Salmonella enterica TaxID=28901 RepID=A0A763MNJ1_SALER|nr:restriction endonuclease subunit S [Salmonella enterica]HAG4415560.1 restriction endonuclease subunit S [Salmonella enterica]HAG4423103.1 restriction endonuclease subunit S [Salmonella enterica]HAG4424404.1 restriction endonuclease subunit S [Salmonella enterica]